MAIEDLPSISLDLRTPSAGNSMVRINGNVVGGVTHLKVEMDADDVIPRVHITFAARVVELELPHAEVTTVREPILVPVLTKSEGT